jgi:myo-inositol-1(or 4)-monophosphatase
MHPMLNIAVKAARRAGAIINRAAQDIDALTVSTKRHNDFVTEVDQAAEQAVIQILLKSFPDHAILAEESGAHGKSDFVWIVDPLDGTTNFIHGFPQYCVSIGLRYKAAVTQAVIYLNDWRMRGSKRKQLDDALIGTGFPFRSHQHMDEYAAVLRQVMEQTAGVRRAGAAALDLAYVATGRLDAFWEMGLSPWDMAAGSLLIQEAGGLVSDFEGDGNYLECGNIVTGTPKVFTPLLQIVASHHPKELPHAIVD